MSGGDRPIVRFGEFELDVAAYELRRRGRRVRLERQPLDLLILLVERRGQLVTHDEIAARLWGEGVFVEVATGIHSAVRKIRRALRDDAEAPRYLESVARRGYRFVAAVEVPPRKLTEALDSVAAAGPGAPAGELAGREPADSSHEPAARSSPARAPTPWRLPAFALLAAAVVALVGWWLWSGEAGVVERGRIRLALLPFENLSGEKELDYLVRGIVDETIAALAQVDPPHLSVVGRTPSAAASREGSAAEVGRALDADYLLEGSVRADAGRLRMTVQLIRVRDLATRWVASFDRERGGLLGLERELARAVAEQVRLRLTPARDEAVARRQTRNPAAYDLYLRGRHAVAQRTPPTVLEGIRSFEAAIAADPDYALAWAEIADAYSGLPINSDFPPLEAWQRSREAAARAVAIRPDLAETQVSLGRIGFFDRDWATAESALRRALEIDPDQAEAHLMLGHLLSQTGRQTEALAESAKARSLDPLAPILHALSAQIAFQARDFEGALGHARQALILAPGFWIGLMQEGQTLEQLGEPQPALEALEHAIRLSGANSKPVSLSGYVLARSGRTEAARAVLARLEETSRTRFVPPYALALVHAGLGETSAALDWLERAERVRDVHLVFLPVDPKWDPLRDDPRFVALLERCGLAGEPSALD